MTTVSPPPRVFVQSAQILRLTVSATCLNKHRAFIC